MWELLVQHLLLKDGIRRIISVRMGVERFVLVIDRYFLAFVRLILETMGAKCAYFILAVWIILKKREIV